MDRAQLAELVEQLQKWPRMFLPSEHYTAYVCFLQGIDTGSGGDLLIDFGRWLARGRETSLYWAGQIERQVTGRDDGSPDGSDMVRRLSDDVSAECVNALLDALRDFVTEAPSTRP